MIAASAIAVLLAQAPAIDPKLQQEVEAHEKALFGAVAARDRATLERRIADGFVFIHSTGQTETKAQYIDKAVAGALSSQTANPEFLERELRVHGDTAIRITRTVRSRGQPGESNLRTVHVHVKVEGQWRYVSGQSTPLATRPRGIALDSGLHGRYVGRYAIDANRTFTVRTDDGTLKGQVTGRPETELIPRSETEFISFQPDSNVEPLIIFVRDAAGAITHAVLVRQGQELWRAPRIK